MKKTIRVAILAKDFTGDIAQYVFVQGCPLALAIKRQFPKAVIYVGSDIVDIDHKIYSFDYYKWNNSIFQEQYRNPPKRQHLILIAKRYTI